MSGFNLRWYVKKSARMAVTLGTGMTGVLALRRRLSDGSALRVLTYHRIGSTLHDPFCVTPEDFAAQMGLLAREGRAVSLQQVQRFLAGEETLPQDACLVTIDDGMLSTLTEALPALQHAGVPAVVYVSASLIGREMTSTGPERYLSWDELRHLADSGLVAIGSHAHTHRSLGLMPLAEAREEIRLSRERLMHELGAEISSFAYPFGTHSDFNDATDQALADCGYSLAFNSVHGAIRQGMPSFSLPRVKVEGGESLYMFSLISRGGMDAWRAVDRSLWRLQRVRNEIS